MEENNVSWKAIYSDGKSLKQFNSDGSENKYVDIDRKKITRFDLYRNKKPAVVIHLNKKKRLIYRMRRAQNNHGDEEVVYLAGWQVKVDDKNIQMISFLFEDGHVEIVDRFNEDHLWFYGVKFLKEEKI